MIMTNNDCRSLPLYGFGKNFPGLDKGSISTAHRDNIYVKNFMGAVKTDGNKMLLGFNCINLKVGNYVIGASDFRFKVTCPAPSKFQRRSNRKGLGMPHTFYTKQFFNQFFWLGTINNLSYFFGQSFNIVLF